MEEELVQSRGRDAYRLPAHPRARPAAEHGVLEPAYVERACVVGIQVRPRDRPAAERDPWLFREIVFVEWSAEPRPVVRGPSQKAEACLRVRLPRMPDVLGVIELLGGFVELEAA